MASAGPWCWLVVGALAACTSPPAAVDAASDGSDASDDGAAADAIDGAADVDAAADAIDAAGPDAGSACAIVAAFDYAAAGHVIAPYTDPATVDTGTGWLIVYWRSPAATRELWATAFSYAGQVVMPPTLIAQGGTPRLAINGDRVLLGFTQAGSPWLQRLTLTGVPVAAPVAVPGLPAGASIAGIAAGPGAELRVIWNQLIPAVFPQRPTRSNVGVVHVDGDGNVLSASPSVVLQAQGLSVVVGRADGSIAAGTSALYGVAGCLACNTAGTATVSASDVLTDHGVAPPDPARGSQIRSITEVGATTYADRQARSPINPADGVATLARFPYQPMATIVATASSVAGLGPTTGAVATEEPDGAWLRSFTDTGTFALGPRCRLDLAPLSIVRRDATTVLVLGDHGARVVTVPF